MSCTDSSCGAPKGRGRPRTGWNKVEGVFHTGGPREDRWYCSWRCLANAAVQEADKEGSPSETPSLWE